MGSRNISIKQRFGLLATVVPFQTLIDILRISHCSHISEFYLFLMTDIKKESSTLT